MDNHGRYLLREYRGKIWFFKSSRFRKIVSRSDRVSHLKSKVPKQILTKSPIYSPILSCVSVTHSNFIGGAKTTKNSTGRKSEKRQGCCMCEPCARSFRSCYVGVIKIHNSERNYVWSLGSFSTWQLNKLVYQICDELLQKNLKHPG